MTITASKFASRTRATPYGECAGDAVDVMFEYDVPATAYVANDILDLGILPANHVITRMTAVSDDLDSNGTPTVVFDVGIMSGEPGDTVSARTCGAEFFSASTLAQAGGVSAMSLKTGYRVAPSNVDRSIGVKFTAIQATAQAGKIALVVTMCPTSWQ